MGSPSKTCCPEGHYYINSLGYYDDPIAGLILIINNSFSIPSFDNSLNHCGQFLNRGFASNLTDPNDCPCCPDGYTYNQRISLCTGDLRNSDVVSPIPCLVCDCTTPTPVECGTCGTDGQRITFSFNFFKRNCIVCNPQDFNPPKGKINCFLPNIYTDPNTTGFTLKQ